jgi:hypothetical protein
MNAKNFLATVWSLLALSSCSCQSQPVPTSSIGDTTKPVSTIRNLIAVDSIPITSLSPYLQDILQKRYAADPSVINIRVIPNPFPRFDSLTLVREFRCNMSPTRVFNAQRTKIFINNGLNRADLQWQGILLNTGVISDRADFNIIDLVATPDSTVPGGYQFFYGSVRVSNTEAYEIDVFNPYFVLIHYNPSKLPLAVCRGTIPTAAATR